MREIEKIPSPLRHRSPHPVKLDHQASLTLQTRRHKATQPPQNQQNSNGGCGQPKGGNAKPLKRHQEKDTKRKTPRESTGRTVGAKRLQEARQQQNSGTIANLQQWQPPQKSSEHRGNQGFPQKAQHGPNTTQSHGGFQTAPQKTQRGSKFPRFYLQSDTRCLRPPNELGNQRGQDLETKEANPPACQSVGMSRS